MIAWLVALYLLLVGLAGGLSLLAWRLWQRHRLPFLRPFALYVSLCFAHALLNFVGETFAPAMFGGSVSERMRVFALVDMGTIPLLAGVFLLLFLWLKDLLGPSVPRGALWLLVAVEVVFLSAFVGMVVSVFGAGSGENAGARTADGISPAAVGAIVLNVVLLTVAVATVLVLRLALPAGPELYRRRIARGLGAVYGVTFVVLALVLLGPTLPFASGPGLGSAFLPVLVFMANVPALLYLRLTLRMLPAAEPAAEFTDEAALAAFGAATGMSGREIEVVRLVVMGLDTRGIGDRLFISPKTVKNHITSVYAKAGVRNRVQLANLVRRGGVAGDVH